MTTYSDVENPPVPKNIATSSVSSSGSATRDSSLHHALRDSTLNKQHLVPVHHSSRDDKARSINYDRFRKKFDDYKDEAKAKTAYDWLATVVPMFAWLRTYRWKSDLIKDLVAGLTVGMMVIPQSMSYAKLAGLPVEYGLYSALVPVYAYALFGSSRQLAVGPVAIVSLMLSTGLTPLVTSNGEVTTEDEQNQYNVLAVQTAMLVGVTYIAMGLLRLGFVTIFLSHAVISGFTTGAAVIIGMSQVKYILGITIPRSDQLVDLFRNIIANISDFNWKTFVLGISCIFALLGLKHIGKSYEKLRWTRAAGPLVVSVVCILVTWKANLSERGIPIVETIPQGLPHVTIGEWSPIDGRLMRTVISIVIIGFMESVAIAKTLAARHKYELDSSLELIGLGMANFFGSMFQSYPVTGSFSRSAVNNDTGAVSGISGIVTATLVMITLLLLTSVFELMPLATLAAIIISGVIGLLDYEEAVYLWKVHKLDFLVWLTSCVCTMFLGVETGLEISVVLSLLMVLYESAYPHTAVLGRLPGSSVYRNVKQYPEAEQYEGIVLCRIDAPIYFANTQYIREKLDKYEALADGKSERPTKYLIVDLSPVSHVDATALHVLKDLQADYKARGITLCLSNPSRVVMDRLVLSGLADQIGRENFYVSTHDAVNACLRAMTDDQESGTAGTADPEILVSEDVMPEQVNVTVE